MIPLSLLSLSSPPPSPLPPPSPFLSLPPLSLLCIPRTCTHMLTCDGVGISDLRPPFLVLGVLVVPVGELELTVAVAVEFTTNVSLALASACGETCTDPPPDSLLCGARKLRLVNFFQAAMKVQCSSQVALVGFYITHVCFQSLNTCTTIRHKCLHMHYTCTCIFHWKKVCA